MSELRSRKTFRFMPAAVLSHNLQVPRQLGEGSALSASAFGRGLYGKKLAQVEHDGAPAAQRLGARAPLTFVRWQHVYRYLILWQRRDFTLTWHAPWCRQCDCPGAGWRFCRDVGYVSGLGFELSYSQE